MTDDPRIAAVPDIHGHAKGEHKLYVDERPIPYTARMLFLWFFHACRRGAPRFLMVADHINYLTFEDPAAVNLVRRALKLAQAGDLYGAAETAGVEVAHASVVGDGLRRGMRYSIGAEVDNDPRSRPDAQNIVDAMRPDGIVRSIHFLPITHPQFGENWMWPFDNPEFRDLYDVVGTEQTWEIYMATLLDAIEKLPGHIVGHFYVPGKFGHWPADDVLESYEDRLLAACAERGMAVEINARPFYKYAVSEEAQLEKYRAVNLRLLRKAKERGVAVAVGSDAHSPKDQGRGFAEILALLDEAEINEISFPIDGRMARVALRATDELRQASARNGIAKGQTEIAIPGTEEPDHVEEPPAEPAPIEAAPKEAVAAQTLGAAPRKRPSRAKKPAVLTDEPEVAAVSATLPDVAASTEPSHEDLVPSASEEAAPPPIATLQAEPDEPVIADAASSSETSSAEEASALAAPADGVPSEAGAATDASTAEAGDLVSHLAGPSAVTVEANQPEETSAPAKALAAVAAVASAAVAAVVSSVTRKRSPVEPPPHEPAESIPGELPKRARPARPIAGSKPPAPKPAAAPKAAAASKSAPAAKATAAPKPAAAASKRTVSSKPGAVPKAVPKPAPKPATKSPARSAAAGKASPAAKPSPIAAKKRTAAKPAPKKAAPARAAGAAKKASPKKAAPVRKPVSKVVSKTASRPSVKKTSAKKTVKKKKQRR